MIKEVQRLQLVASGIGIHSGGVFEIVSGNVSGVFCVTILICIVHEVMIICCSLHEWKEVGELSLFAGDSVVATGPAVVSSGHWMLSLSESRGSLELRFLQPLVGDRGIYRAHVS